MDDLETFSLKLTDKQAAALKTAVESGAYATTNDVVQEALREWQLRHALQPEDLVLIGQLWDRGVASGSAGDLDMNDLRREAEARLERARKSAG